MNPCAFTPYPDEKILEHCRSITLNDLSGRLPAVLDNRIKTLSNALQTANAHECTAHLMEWPDGIQVCIVSAVVKSFFEVSPAAKIAAYQKAVLTGDVVYRDLARIDCA